MPMSSDPASSAVLFIECQNGLLGEDSPLRAVARAARTVVPQMSRLADGARVAGVRVVHLTYESITATGAINRRSPLFARLGDGLTDWVAGHPATQPIPEIGVGPDDLVLPRHSGLSPTHGTDTFKVLRNLGVRAVVIAGISVNIAIPVVATEAVDEDFDVVIATDAVVGDPPEHVASMMQYTLAFVARLSTVDELLATWDVPAAAPA
jgi:nicotinamidase-related amidase